MTQELSGSLRVLGIDEGYFPPEFKRRRLRTILVGVLCIDTKPVSVKVVKVTVDYDDVTGKIIHVTRSMKDLNAILLDGVTYAGFNVVNPESIYRVLGVPVITIFKHDLNLGRIRYALLKHFDDGAKRFDIISNVYGRSYLVKTPWRALRVSTYGISRSDALDLIVRLQTVSPIPEPLRLADIIASGLTRRSGLLDLLQ